MRICRMISVSFSVIFIVSLVMLFALGCFNARANQYAIPETKASEAYAMAAAMPASYEAEVEIDYARTYQEESFSPEEYSRIVDNPFLPVLDNPVSTFSIDVDTASYANVRRFLLNEYELPLKDAVRIEEMVNYFSYDYNQPENEDPISFDFTMAPAPWNPNNHLLRIALKAKEIDLSDIPPSNLVFLLDTSGSMSDDNKLPLVKQSLKILINQLRPEDKVSVVAYAGTTGLILDATSGSEKDRIIDAFDHLDADGSTAGGAGIQLAYDIAKMNFIAGGNNRIILCTDGDFNVGTSSTSELERLIEEKRKDDIYLTVLGFGMGNYKDNRMEILADKGNGNYAYIDYLLEAKKVLGKEIWGNLFTVAKDVKIQIEFNPSFVQEYRLIGYENRKLAREDFNDDTKDAGEMGSGHTVTAFYELVTTGTADEKKSHSDPLVFQQSTIVPSSDLFQFKLRYKDPKTPNGESILVSKMVNQSEIQSSYEEVSIDYKFATAVIEFGMLLRDSPYKGTASYDTAMQRAIESKGTDIDGYRAELIKMIEMASILNQ